MALTIEDANAILQESFAPWVLELGLRVVAVDPAGVATLTMPASERIARVGGTICGQALMALADTAMVFAIAAEGASEPAVQVSSTYALLGAPPGPS